MPFVQRKSTRFLMWRVCLAERFIYCHPRQLPAPPAPRFFKNKGIGLEAKTHPYGICSESKEQYMKKMLIFSLAYYPSNVSGAEAAIKEITDRINPSDVEFHMVTLLFDRNALRNERMGNVYVHRVGFGGAYLSKNALCTALCP